ncbi:hypothetical protein [uncultured Roseobacter sp.]|uniref:hypothetical protein n=1 Tax=uncultured Roseobacter sp. TaxID=114847 RepID=UPI002626911A|nr:hypothetical protein [uncultured Roseobacter sp.]
MTRSQNRLGPVSATSVNDEPLPEGSSLHRWQDTAGAPLDGRKSFKTWFETIAGKLVILCDVLIHDGSGMMQIVEVIE